VPGKCFPTRYRSSSHSFSATSGKIGSIIAQAAIAPLRTRGANAQNAHNANPWQNHVMQIYALFMFVGIFTTILIRETARISLEKLSGEDIDEVPVEQKKDGDEDRNRNLSSNNTSAV
jgi:MFS transporter, PHS family, inorganic phosphate transporter